MTKVEIYTKKYCPYCIKAKALLTSKGIEFAEFEISFDQALQAEMQRRSKGVTVPQIFIDGSHIGGSDELLDLERAGELDPLLKTIAA